MRDSAVALCVALVTCVASGNALAAVPLDDSKRGMTCYFYSAAANLGWQRKGGDWVDAEGERYGSIPYATQDVPSARDLQVVQFDVTDLARAWAKGTAPVGGIFLRAIPGGKVSNVTFNSREHADKETHPTLIISWEDGRRSRVTANADTFFRCPTHKSLGKQSYISVGFRDVSILVFPFENRDHSGIRSAALVLTSNKRVRRTTSIGVFRPLLPTDDPGAARQGIAERFRYDEGIETHPDVIFAEGFESERAYEKWAGDNVRWVGEIVTKDSANRLEPLSGRALRARIDKGDKLAMNTHFRFEEHGGSEPEEAYFRYYLRFGETWNPTATGGKLPGFSGTYGRAGWGGRKSDGYNGWSARGAFFRQPDRQVGVADLRGIGSYVYLAQSRGKYGDHWGWNLGPSGLLQKNRWYCIEQNVQLNTPGKADGVFRAWVDGQLVIERTGLRYRDTEQLKIESVWLNVFHGGTAVAPTDMTLFIDNLVVAHDYVGPMQTSR
jgi:hypothetical protein